MMQYFKDKSKVVNGAATQDVSLSFQGDIIVGDFVERNRPTYTENYESQMTKTLGSSFVPFEGVK